MTTTERRSAAASENPTRGSSAPGLFWTTANIGEAAPAVLTPLCWSLWGPGNELAVRTTWHRFGMVGPDEIVVDPDQSKRLTGIFYGRQAMNMDAIRHYVDRFPGMTGDEFEFGLAGAARADAEPVARLTDLQQAMVAETVEAVRATHRERLDAEVKRELEWWRAEIFGAAGSGTPVERLQDAFERFVRAIGLHNETRLLSTAAMSGLYRLAATVDSIDTVPAVTSAFGDVTELSMADDLWALAHGDLEQATFLERHGYHGENEGNPAGHSWREDPGLLDRTLTALRNRHVDEHPQRRAERAGRQAREAIAALEAKLDEGQRAELAVLLAEIADVVRETELGKASFLAAIDGFRAAARDLGDELVERGVLHNRDDVFFLSMDELAGDLGPEVSASVDSRRQDWAEFNQVSLPMTFYGMPEPLAQTAGRVQPGETLQGIGVSGSTHEGRVRIIRRADDYTDLEAGDVLVCETTDPSWTALFLLADALVIDVGSVGSHGAIVARELGLPAVVNTSDGTRRLRDGDRVIVDGTKGTVTVVSVVEPDSGQ
ncbi:PEP-utilizing enzyme [Nocardia carnea]|uniref:PEP-utilizing enzyme n=1 Tax=Nocardia carnea TaxID=37328 RepID=UPI0024549983|nr:PEP-utilizing enzyme [Nocardia carnea]